MLEELAQSQIEECLGSSSVSGIPRYSDRDRWASLLSNPMMQESVRILVTELDRELAEPLTHVPASLYLNYSRTGNRSPHDVIIHRRRKRLIDFVLGECMERSGRFMDPLMDHAWAICEETSWVIPAHTRTTLPDYSEHPYVDLVSAGTALSLAEAAYVMGRRLDDHDPMIGRRIVHEIDRRCWRPYLERNDYWWLYARERAHVNNWTAVCNCGVVGSALLLMADTQDLARMVEKCIRSMNDYLRCFDPDGGSDEGPSYWAYGVSHYVWLSYLLEARTGGRIGLMNAPEMRKIALFPQRVTLCGQNVANFSDCPPRVAFSPSLLFYMGQRLNMSGLCAFAQRQYDLAPRTSCGLRDLVWMPRERCGEAWQREIHIYYSGLQWMIGRADPRDDESLVLAVKGGHNGENHNHNDVGNFIVCYGGESLIVDLGSGTYTRDYFGPGRYEILVNSSWGHNVPLVNGKQQAPGPQHAAKLLRHTSSPSEDMLALDLKDAYPAEAGIRSLSRSTSLHRDPTGAWIEVVDRVEFAEGPGQYRNPLYTWGNVTVGSDRTIRISGDKASIKVEFDPGTVEVVIEEVGPGNGKLSDGKVRRIVQQVSVAEGNGGFRTKIVPSLPEGC